MQNTIDCKNHREVERSKCQKHSVIEVFNANLIKLSYMLHSELFRVESKIIFYYKFLLRVNISFLCLFLRVHVICTKEKGTIYILGSQNGLEGHLAEEFEIASTFSLLSHLMTFH